MNNNQDGSPMGMSNNTTNNTNSPGMVTGMFRNREHAETAYAGLTNRGYTSDEVNLLMSKDTRETHFGDQTDASDLGNKAMSGTGVGSAVGGTLGAVVGAIAAIGTTLALPGLGLLIAGPVAGALAGAGAGGLTGGLVGALVGSGIPEDRAKEYETGLKEGGIVMGINPRNTEDADYVADMFKTSNGESIHR